MGNLELVWTNLLSNAFKFTLSGGKVRLEQKSTGNKIRVSVLDTGCGMGEETMAGMLLFMTITMMTPINAIILHVVMRLAGSAMFGIGGGLLGAGFLQKRDLA